MSQRDPYYGPPLWWLAAYVAATAAVAWLYYSTAYGAPAPREKPPPAVGQGEYEMTWRGVPCKTCFRDEGNYHCYWQGRWWRGRWRCEAGTLHVEEWHPDSPESVCRWEVKLSSPVAGTMGGDCPWKLVVARGRVD